MTDENMTESVFPGGNLTSPVFLLGRCLPWLPNDVSQGFFPNGVVAAIMPSWEIGIGTSMVFACNIYLVAHCHGSYETPTQHVFLTLLQCF